ncbi:CASP8 and FADD-like apoptosis regulator [Hypomesus transpacificus]|uniref:CASP8 and FADD-like apoptosis regulator n=1 Tax=Hypomesus transpacificus TaxID=137520 RepID=UPI001F088014|nr:CASP8 and FADD-like apoptosis regulator [Hypomesus transpacificus]
MYDIISMGDGQLLQTINRLAEELSSSECRRLAYLCESPGSVSSGPDVREMLRARLSQGEVNHLYLVELMFRLGRFDLLRKVLLVDKQDVERILGHLKGVSEYRYLMDDLSEDMGSEDLQAVLFLLSHTLPRDRRDKITNFLDVVVELEKLDKVSSDSVDMIEQCLRNVGRVDLAKKVNLYQSSVGTSHPPSVVQHQRVEPRTERTAATATFSLKQRHSFHQSVPHKVYVAEPETRRPYCQSPVEDYRLRTDGPGVCVIIDCVGSDGGMLKETFTQLHFKVILHKWLSVEEMLSVLRGVSKQREIQEADALVVCIISRGTATDLLGTDSDSVGVRLDSVRNLFTSDTCPRLTGKPKLFFIQSYRVPKTERRSRAAHRDEDLETDGLSSLTLGVETVPAGADVFWGNCWTEERQLEETAHHSVYLQALSQSLVTAQRRRTHLVDVHTEINGMIFDHNRKSPGAIYHINLRHTLRKNLYLQ